MSKLDTYDNLKIFIQDNIDDFEYKLSCEPYFIKTKTLEQDGKDTLYMFEYSLFDSDLGNPIVRCCRGSVFKINKEKKEVVPYILPFYVFRNFGEKNSDEITWNKKTIVRDKVDGSLIKMIVEDDGNLLWTTNASFDLDNETYYDYTVETDEKLQEPHTFRQLVEYALTKHYKDTMCYFQPGVTYMFELISPYNKIIVPYSETDLILLGARDNETYEEIEPELLAEYVDFDIPETLSLNSVEEILAYNKTLMGKEGIVVQDEYFNRVKIKCEDYLRLKILKGETGFSEKTLFNIVKNGDFDDAIANFPEIEDKVNDMIQTLEDLYIDLDTLRLRILVYYQKVCKPDEVGEQEAKKKLSVFVFENYSRFMSGWCFKSVKENYSIKDELKKLSFDKFKKLCEYFGILD
jgi:RNA ligase